MISECSRTHFIFRDILVNRISVSVTVRITCIITEYEKLISRDIACDKELSYNVLF